MTHRVRFLPETHAPIELPRGAVLSEHLDIGNSPLLFGCRTGICGTCLIEVEAEENGALAPPSADEQELLDLLAPDRPRARLACQLALTADLAIRRQGREARQSDGQNGPDEPSL